MGHGEFITTTKRRSFGSLPHPGDEDLSLGTQVLSLRMTNHRLWTIEERRSGRQMKIAIQGEPGSFSHEAAMKLVPDGEIVPCLAFGGGLCGAERRSGGYRR